MPGWSGRLTKRGRRQVDVHARRQPVPAAVPPLAGVPMRRAGLAAALQHGKSGGWEGMGYGCGTREQAPAS